MRDKGRTGSLSPAISCASAFMYDARSCGIRRGHADGRPRLALRRNSDVRHFDRWPDDWPRSGTRAEAVFRVWLVFQSRVRGAGHRGGLAAAIMLGDIIFPDVLDEAKAESGWADTILAGAFAPPPAGFAPAAHGITGKGARYAVRVFDDRARISPAGRTETDYVDAFLDEFGARRGKPVLFEDALFRDAAGKYKVTQGGRERDARTWSGVTAFPPKQVEYLKGQRTGKLVYRRSEGEE